MIKVECIVMNIQDEKKSGLIVRSVDEGYGNIVVIHNGVEIQVNANDLIKAVDNCTNNHGRYVYRGRKEF